jgi:signal transduction histidine kinase
MDNGQFHLPVTAPGSTTENFMLSVRAVSSADFRISATDTAAPFQISGLLFELVNVSQLKGVYAIKDEFVERFGQRMRRELSAILLAGDLLQENKLSQRNSARTRRVLREKIAATVDMFRQARRYMQVKVAGPGLGVYPVDATTPVLSAMHALDEAAQARGIRFSTRLPEVVSLVNAAPDELDRLMQLLLDALLDDAAENTVIEIGVEERDDTVRYRLRNDGFGIPNERFQAYLFGGKNVVADEFKALHDAISCVDEWEGSVAANSEVGSGMAFDIELKAVI